MLRDLYQEMGGGTVQDDQNTQAGNFQQLADGSLLIYGSAGPAMYQDAYVIKTDTSGKKQWSLSLVLQERSRMALPRMPW